MTLIRWGATNSKVTVKMADEHHKQFAGENKQTNKKLLLTVTGRKKATHTAVLLSCNRSQTGFQNFKEALNRSTKKKKGEHWRVYLQHLRLFEKKWQTYGMSFLRVCILYQAKEQHWLQMHWVPQNSYSSTFRYSVS